MAEITAKTAPQPPLPGEAPEAEVLHIETLLTEYRNHVVVGLLLVLVATVVYFWYTNNLEVRTAKAWDEFGLLLDKEDKEERLKGFERLLELEASGTQVKPWLLWQLAHTYVSLQNYDKAKTTLKQLKKDHPRHYLNTRREIASDPESTFVKKALVALEKEIEFWQNWKAPPKENLPKAKILTSKGTIEVELFQDHCPEVVKMFVHLAETGFYDNLKFRDAFDKKIYTGTLMADGKGHPAYTLKKSIRMNLI
jgi:tetratricopeptide (TPR) repeat protein